MAFNNQNKREVPSYIMLPRILLLFAVFCLLLMGLVMVFSASSVAALTEGVDPTSYVTDQFLFTAVGVVCALILWKILPYSLWESPALWIIWGIAIVLLVCVAFFGTAALGAQRWLQIGPIGLQPSEFAKIAFVLMGAKLLNSYRTGFLTFRDFAVQGFLLVLVPILFLYQTQSDLGTTLICMVGVFAVAWVGEVPLKILLGVVFFALIFVLIAVFFTGYRSDRLLFLNPWDDGEGGYGSGYQLIHSFYAFAEGGLFGVGLGNSKEKYSYLPEAETDFIFAVIGEELGLVGAFAVVLLFLLFLFAGLRIAQSAPDNFGAMVAGSCTIMLTFQAFLNIGCVIGLLPTTGKPLPFISSGGSSLIASMIMVGLILSVSQGSSAPTVYDRRRDNLRVVWVDSQVPQGRSETSRRSRDRIDASTSRTSGRW